MTATLRECLRGAVDASRPSEVILCHFCGQECDRESTRLVGHDRRWCGACEGGRAVIERRIAHAIRVARLPTAFADCADRDVVLQRMHGDEPALRRVDEWAAALACNLTLQGETGAGKTSAANYAAISIIAAAAGAGDVLFINAFDLGLARRNSPLGEEADLVKNAIAARVLVLDDVGSEPATQAEAMAYVVSKRHEAGDYLRTILTTWMTADELVARYGAGVARRMLDRATVVTLQGAK